MESLTQEVVARGEPRSTQLTAEQKRILRQDMSEKIIRVRYVGTDPRKSIHE